MDSKEPKNPTQYTTKKGSAVRQLELVNLRASRLQVQAYLLHFEVPLDRTSQVRGGGRMKKSLSLSRPPSVHCSDLIAGWPCNAVSSTSADQLIIVIDGELHLNF